MRKYFHALGLLLLIALMAKPSQAASVCIDPGHGGSDPGAQGCGLSEAKINLQVSLKLRDLLKASGVTVYMTRETDVFVGLSARASYANSKGVDRFASVHSNAGGGTGIETFCMEGSSSTSLGYKMASAIQTQMLKVWPLPDRGVKKANFAVLRETDMAATLSELAFIDKCSPDAEYLGSAAHRDNAASAHCIAITSHLGVNGSCSAAPPTDGKAMGAIFEDKGSGTDDMSTRLEGATATVKGTSMTMTVSGPDAFYSFDLKAGTYDIEASMDGYDSNTVSCVVTAGQTQWCSIGLKKSEPAKPDGGLDQPDARPDVFTSPDAAEQDVEREAGQEDAEQEDARRPPGPNYWSSNDDSGCSCRTTQPRGGLGFGVGTLMALGLFAARRRRLLGGLLGLSALALLGCDQDASHHGTITKATAPLATQPTAQPTPRLASQRKILNSQYILPVLSPDGAWLAATHPGLNQLWIASTSDGALKNISQAPRSGYMPSWRADSQAIAFRDGNADPSGNIWSFSDLAAQRAASFLSSNTVSVRQTEDDRIVLRVGGREHTIDEGKDKYFSPSVSQDGSWVVYTGITLGIHLYHVPRGETVQLGQGTHPSLSADGTWLAYEKTDDDGHSLISGDLYLCDLRDTAYPVFNLTRTPREIERTPSLSADGRLIAYVQSDGVYLATIER